MQCLHRRSKDSGERVRREREEHIFNRGNLVGFDRAVVFLNELSMKDIIQTSECPYDQGYSMVSGSEKVIVAQERMASNTILIFKKSQPAQYTHYLEIKSVPEKGSKTPPRLLNKDSEKSKSHLNLSSFN